MRDRALHSEPTISAGDRHARSASRGFVGVAFDPALRRPAANPYADPARLDRMVREAVEGAGLGEGGARQPLERIVPRDATVLLKPNWVYHENAGGGGLDCLNTHGAFLLAVLRAIAPARPGRVLIGDSPIQGSRFSAIAGPSLLDEARRAAGGAPVEIRDFRKVVLADDGLVAGHRPTGRTERDYATFDLGADSLVEPISRPPGRFRVTMYDPRTMREAHAPGRHRYVLCREALEADVFINLPKLKTHRKAGVTIALKNLVGVNGNKDFLPHHRVGGSGLGGDCYPGVDPIRRMAEYFLDRANAAAGTPAYAAWRWRCDLLMRVQRRLGRDTDLEGGWHGNDTCWRMVLDLNRLLLYGRPDGTLSETPLRRIVSIVDGIVAGQGEGPLAPDPLALGCVLCGGDSPSVDWVGASLIGLDPARIALVREAFGRFRYPLDAADPEGIGVRLAGDERGLAEAVASIGVRARPPVGWVGHCEAAA